MFFLWADIRRRKMTSYPGIFDGFHQLELKSSKIWITEEQRSELDTTLKAGLDGWHVVFNKPQEDNTLSIPDLEIRGKEWTLSMNMLGQTRISGKAVRAGKIVKALAHAKGNING